MYAARGAEIRTASGGAAVSRATYLEFPAMNHYFEREPSKANGLRSFTHRKPLGPFDPTFLPGIERWLSAAAPAPAR